MHSCLHRKGWPQAHPILNNNTLSRVGSELDNSLDHYIFFPKLAKIVDVSKSQKKFLKELFHWKNPETKRKISLQDGLNILHNAFVILDGFTYGEDSKKEIKKRTKIKYSKTLELALELDQIRTSNSANKKGVRKSIKESLDTISNFLKTSTKTFNFNEFIAISPLFTDELLEKPAKDTITLTKESKYFFGDKIELIFLTLKSDGSLIGGTETNNLNITKIEESFNNKTLKCFLNEINIIYGIG